MLDEGLVMWALAPFVEADSRTHWVGLVLAMGVAWWLAPPRQWRIGQWLRHPSVRLDVQLLAGRQLLRALGALPSLAGSWWLATHLVRVLDATLGAPTGGALPAGVATALYTLGLFIVWDASRYAVHRLLHAVPALWAIHQVHHSADVLTPLTFHRVHPLESLLYDLRGTLVTGLAAGVGFWVFRTEAVAWTVLGVHGVGWVLNAATGNLRHSHVWLSFGPRIERWWISPAQHQRHHSRDSADQRTNYGTWLAVWDRLGGSWQPAGAAPPRTFGVDADARNHGDDLVSAWFGPLVAWLRALVAWLRALVAWLRALVDRGRPVRASAADSA